MPSRMSTRSGLSSAHRAPWQRLSRRNRQPGWRIIIPETKDRGGGALSWRVAVPWDNRDTFIEMAGRHLGCYGWDAVAWPTEIGTTMTIPLIRNTSGHQIDEAERLHRAAGVTYHKAHHAYIAAVAATVEAAGIVIGDIGSDCDEPRGGNFRIGGDLEDFWDDDEGYGPPWSSSGARTAAGITSGSLTPRPRSATTPKTSPATCRSWPRRSRSPGPSRRSSRSGASAAAGSHQPCRPGRCPADTRADPPCPEDDGWDVSPRLERSLTAYAGLRPPEGLPAWLARSQRITVIIR